MRTQPAPIGECRVEVATDRYVGQQYRATIPVRFIASGKEYARFTALMQRED